MKTRLLHLTVTPVIAAAVIALSAQLSFPLPATDIPQTAQTIAVLVCGSLLGPVPGALAVLMYLLAGVLGLPVYSDGGSGWQTLLGSSAGYFLGFVLAAALTGVLRQSCRSNALWLLSVHMFAAHQLILVMGWLWLSVSLGLVDGFYAGVTPFIYGAIVKSVLCALVVLAMTKIPPQWQQVFAGV